MRITSYALIFVSYPVDSRDCLESRRLLLLLRSTGCSCRFLWRNKECLD